MRKENFMETSERRERIMKNLQEKYDFISEKGFELLGVFLHGSQNYNLDINDAEYESDVDAKAIVLPTLNDLVFKRSPESTTLEIPGSIEQIDLKDIRSMNESITKQNISYIQILFTEFYIVNPKYADEVEYLRLIRDELCTIDEAAMARGILGMCFDKMKHLTDGTPAREEVISKFGYDPKQYHHLARLSKLAVDHFTMGKPLAECIPVTGEDRDDLIAKKLGKDDLETAKENSEKYVEIAREVYDHTIALSKKNPEAKKKLDKWTLDTISKYLKESLSERKE